MLSAIELSDLTSSLLFIQGRSCWCSVRSAVSECIPHRLVACTLLSAGNGGLVTEREGGKPWGCHPPEGRMDLNLLERRKMLLILWIRKYTVLFSEANS